MYTQRIYPELFIFPNSNILQVPPKKPESGTEKKKISWHQHNSSLLQATLAQLHTEDINKCYQQ